VGGLKGVCTQTMRLRGRLELKKRKKGGIKGEEYYERFGRMGGRSLAGAQRLKIAEVNPGRGRGKWREICRIRLQGIKKKNQKNARDSAMRRRHGLHALGKRCRMLEKGTTFPIRWGSPSTCKGSA